MPGSVANAAPTTVLPRSLCSAYARAQEFPLLSNQYSDGAFQGTVQATVSRKRWIVSKRLPPDVLQELRAFYEARKGRTEPFYFYDPYETSPKFSHDSTGVATAGRYTVRFDSDWDQSTGTSRSDLAVSLIELA
jgi:hypothetical protein